ncbi:MAG TPA: CoA transferase, partial [Dehalococcoidia bacterium]|nr:CoA transferase [Dehalococcoidia bacterium]
LERYRDVAARKRHEDELDATIAAWTRELDHYDVMHRLQAGGVPAGAALDCAEMFDDSHMSARGQFEWVRHPELGDSPHTRVAWKLRGTPSPVTVPAPCFGQHNDEVLRGLLGMSEPEIARLSEAGVIANEPPPLPGH